MPIDLKQPFGEVEGGDPDGEDTGDMYRGAAVSTVEVESVIQEFSGFFRMVRIWLGGESVGGDAHGVECREMSCKL